MVWDLYDVYFWGFMHIFFLIFVLLGLGFFNFEISFVGLGGLYIRFNWNGVVGLGSRKLGVWLCCYL